jgi:hypothetical protein
MSNTPELAPSWLPRQQRRRIDRELHRLLRQDNCSICKSALTHNSRTTGGLDGNGKVVMAGECCISRVVTVFGSGLYVDHQYDFMVPSGSKPASEASREQILDAIAATQDLVADTDKKLDTITRQGGVEGPFNVSRLNHPWKDDDRDWFERNPTRAHRVRMPFPGEVDEFPAEAHEKEAPAGRALIILVRQFEPGYRSRAGFYLNSRLLPVPDDEAVAHALFEVAGRREPVPSNQQAFLALVEKYTARRAQE